MTGGPAWQTSLREKTTIPWLCCALFYLAAGKTAQILYKAVVLLPGRVFTACQRESADGVLWCKRVDSK